MKIVINGKVVEILGGSGGSGVGARWAQGYSKDSTRWTSVLKLFPARQLVLCEGSYEILEKGDE